MTARIRPSHVAWVAVGGAAGTLARVGVGEVWSDVAAWPVATFTVNVTGSFALGFLLEMLVRRGTESAGGRRVRLALGTGFLGAFTTFSALAIEVERMLADARVGEAALYAVGSVVVGLVACAAGVAVSARAHRAPALPLPADPDSDEVDAS